MTRLLLALPLLALADCATDQRPYAPVENVRYQAMGTEPFWYLAIGDDRIVLRLGHRRDEQPEDEFVFPRTLPRIVNGVRTWQSEGAVGISIWARPGPCADSAGRRYEDNVTVQLSILDLTGCGGRLVGERR